MRQRWQDRLGCEQFDHGEESDDTDRERAQNDPRVVLLDLQPHAPFD